MRVVPLAAAQVVTAHGSTGFRVGSVARSDDVGCTVLRLEPGGVIGRHDAPVGQLLLVLSGSAQVSGADDVVADVGPRSAVWWQAGESHEVRSREGLFALAVEAPELAPAE